MYPQLHLLIVAVHIPDVEWELNNLENRRQHIVPELKEFIGIFHTQVVLIQLVGIDVVIYPHLATGCVGSTYIHCANHLIFFIINTLFTPDEVCLCYW